MTNNKTGETKTEMTQAARQINWKEAGLRYGIINMESRGEAAMRFKIWITDDKAAPSKFWIEPGRSAIVTRPSGDYTFTARQLYATGLQVAKDPGVLWVYIGCITMLLGLVVAFFMSHRKLWVFIKEEDGKVVTLFAGSANKNKLGFERTFTELVENVKG